jgi:hypothetical protein
MNSYSIDGLEKKTLVVKKRTETTGGVYLPGKWVGEEVEVVRTGRKVVE